VEFDVCFVRVKEAPKFLGVNGEPPPLTCGLEEPNVDE
jgi:hypothetical protein